VLIVLGGIGFALKRAKANPQAVGDNPERPAKEGPLAPTIGISFEDAVKSGIRRTFQYQGRASRSEYWWYYLCFVIAGVISQIAERSSALADGSGGASRLLLELFVFLLLIIELILLLGLVSLGVRRLHDVDYSGWWLLLSFVPVIGQIFLLVQFCTQGTNGENRFG
jgi:uncharacterized membrane protein YhaH (DUF805 family)